MSLIPAIHSWNLTNYARRLNSNSATKTEYAWSCLNINQTPIKMTITPALQLLIISSDQCIEELIDIWLMFNYTHIHVHRKSILFNYTWPPTPSSTNLTRSFRVKFSDDKDLNQCVQFLRDYFPVNIYSPNDFSICIESIQPTMFHSLLFNEINDTLALEQSTTMNIRTDFVRQYLSTCIMDPTFFIIVNENEKYLKNILKEK
ncbi:unnamed protein product [Rotaria magnacalcarata]|uniref:Uncharacterized protein n=1 Tax=Rotaria magnacalcarata TaxID=392030 RepID=A0A819BNV8_9BILA|nr:unnamed protein product [Rotaria magnacalcarata]CAF3805170.1 unnamed protein product [Rotaria magnacalcarata]